MGIDDMLETEHGFVLNEAVDYEIYTEKSGNLLKTLLNLKTLSRNNFKLGPYLALIRILRISRELSNLSKNLIQIISQDSLHNPF